MFKTILLEIADEGLLRHVLEQFLGSPWKVRSILLVDTHAVIIEPETEHDLPEIWAILSKFVP